MTEYSETDIIDGYIEYGIRKIPKAQFQMENAAYVVADDTITIDENYTSGGSTSNDVEVLDGRIDDADQLYAQNVKVISKAEELLTIRPQETYTDYREFIVADLINENCAEVTCTATSSSITLSPNGDNDDDGWEDTTGGDSDGDLFDEVDETGSNDGNYIRSEDVDDYVDFTLSNHSLSANYHYDVYKIKITISARTNGDASLDVYLKSGTTTIFAEIIDYDNASFTDKSIEDDTLSLYESDIDDLRVYIITSSLLGAYVDIERVEVEIYYKYYANLDKTASQITVEFKGEKDLTQILDTLANNELKTWYLDRSLELYFNDADIDSGEDFTSSDNYGNIDGKQQIKSYDKIVVFGAYVNGVQLTSETGSGTIIWKETNRNFTTQAGLDAFRAQLETEKAQNPYEIVLMRVDSTVGVMQVGETVDISASDIKFTESDKYVPAGTYIIDRCRVYFGASGYQKSEYRLIDSLIFSKTGDPEARLPYENSAAIEQVASTVSDNVSDISDIQDILDNIIYSKIVQYEGDGSNDRTIDPSISWDIHFIFVQRIYTTDHAGGGLTCAGDVEESMDYHSIFASDVDNVRKRVWIDGSDPTTFHVSDGNADAHFNQNGTEYQALLLGGNIDLINVGTS